MDNQLFRIAGRWEKGESPTEEEITQVYNEFPEILNRMASFMNGLANIADTDVSATQLRHMAARYLGRDTLPETSKGHQTLREFNCIVPMHNSQALVNAIGSNETECFANLSLLDLSDDEMNQVNLLIGKLVVTE